MKQLGFVWVPRHKQHNDCIYCCDEWKTSCTVFITIFPFDQLCRSVVFFNVSFCMDKCIHTLNAKRNHWISYGKKKKVQEIYFNLNELKRKESHLIISSFLLFLFLYLFVFVCIALLGWKKIILRPQCHISLEFHAPWCKDMK